LISDKLQLSEPNKELLNLKCDFSIKEEDLISPFEFLILENEISI